MCTGLKRKRRLFKRQTLNSLLFGVFWWDELMTSVVGALG